MQSKRQQKQFQKLPYQQGAVFTASGTFELSSRSIYLKGFEVTGETNGAVKIGDNALVLEGDFEVSGSGDPETIKGTYIIDGSLKNDIAGAIDGVGVRFVAGSEGSSGAIFLSRLTQLKPIRKRQPSASLMLKENQ